MRPSDLAETLKSLIPKRRPLYIWGPPGVGKSSIVHQAAAALGMGMIDLRAVLLDPVDLRGLPYVNTVQDGVRLAGWAPPDFLPLEGVKVPGRPEKGIIFADELAQAVPLVQAGFLQGILDHAFGSVKLDRNWVWVAASNRQEDRAGAHRLISPMLNRFIHVDLELNNEDWQAWAVNAGISPEVRSYINFKPESLFDFDPTRNQRAFPTPRSWEFVSQILDSTPLHLLHPVISGTVGDGAASEFIAFVKIYRDLPDPDEVLANPEAFKVPKDLSVLYALCGALVDRVKAADKDKLARFMKIVEKLPYDFGMLCVKDVSVVNRSIFLAPGASAWIRQSKSFTLAS